MNYMANTTFSTQTLKQDLKDFQKLNPQRKAIIILVIVGLFVLSIVVGSYLSKGKQSTTEEITNTTITQAPEQTEQKEGPTTNLTLSPKNSSLTVNGTKKIDVVITEEPVTATDIVITYDPEAVEVSGLVNGNVFSKMIRNKIEDGMITYSASIDPSNPKNISTGTVFSFTVKALKAGSTVLDFNQSETITAVNGNNTLGTTTGSQLDIK